MIFRIENSLPEFVCDEIIEKFESSHLKVKRNIDLLSINKSFEVPFNSLTIPKFSPEWQSIERLIFKELLVNLRKFKDSCLESFTSEAIELLNKFNQPLILNDIVIHKYEYWDNCYRFKNFNKIYNRSNVITFIFVLNGDGCIEINNTLVKFNQSNLIMFPDKYELSYNVENSTPQYLITGQLFHKLSK